MPVGIDDEEPPAFSFRPGDVVLVAVDTEPERAPQELTVDAQGRIHVAGAGQVRVGGLTVARAQARIAATVQKMDRLAQVQLQVMDTPGQRATVLGAVTTQGSVAVAPGMRVAQLISDSGGELSSEPSDTDDATITCRATSSTRGRSRPLRRVVPATRARSSCRRSCRATTSHTWRRAKPARPRRDDARA